MTKREPVPVPFSHVIGSKTYDAKYTVESTMLTVRMVGPDGQYLEKSASVEGRGGHHIGIARLLLAELVGPAR